MLFIERKNIMHTERLTAESFELSQAVIIAINRLSIHTKLALIGADEGAPGEIVEQARQTLRRFLDRFAPVVRDIEKDEGPTSGTDPRLRTLAQKFVSAKRKSPGDSPLFHASVEEVKELLDAQRPSDQQRLIECLRTLRALMEEHSHADVVGMLGEL
jgi:hypothetical protein